ncbi:unnamed protein product [Prunus armeniaca]
MPRGNIKKNQINGGTVAGTVAMTSAALVLDLGLKLPSGQPEFVGPTSPPGLGSPLETAFCFFPPQPWAQLIAGTALRVLNKTYEIN